MFLCGICELYGIATWGSVYKTKLAKYTVWAKEFGKKASSEENMRRMREAGLPGVACRSIFEYVAMIAVALFAFKATFFLMLPIWLVTILGRPAWRRNHIFYVINNSICAALYFMAAWVVA